MELIVDFSAQPISIKITRGDTLPLEIHVVDEVVDEDDSAVPLLGTTFIFTVEGPGEVVVLTMTPSNVATPEYEVQGIALFQSAAGATDLPEDTYHYDLQWTSGSIIRTLLYGRFIVAAQITN